MAATLGPRLHTLRCLLALDHSHRTQPRYFARQSRPVDHVNDFVDVLICLWNFFHDSLAGFAAHDDSLLFEFPFNLLCVASFGGRGAAEQTVCAVSRRPDVRRARRTDGASPTALCLRSPLLLAR